MLKEESLEILVANINFSFFFIYLKSTRTSYDIIKKQGIFAYRVHDTSIKHIWHEKHCGHLKSIDKKRYFMCVGSKLGVEGNWRQQGAQVLELQDALNGQAKTGLSG